MDFKLLNNMLDFKTYIQLLSLDLKTCNKHDPLKVFDHTYVPFLEKNLNSGSLNFQELNVIQQTVLKDRDAFPDCNKTYQLTVEKALERMLDKYHNSREWQTKDWTT